MCFYGTDLESATGGEGGRKEEEEEEEEEEEKEEEEEERRKGMTKTKGVRWLLRIYTVIFQDVQFLSF